MVLVHDIVSGFGEEFQLLILPIVIILPRLYRPGTAKERESHLGVFLEVAAVVLQSVSQSVGQSVSRSVGQSVSRSVGQSVCLTSSSMYLTSISEIKYRINLKINI